MVTKRNSTSETEEQKPRVKVGKITLTKETVKNLSPRRKETDQRWGKNMVYGVHWHPNVPTTGLMLLSTEWNRGWGAKRLKAAIFTP